MAWDWSKVFVGPAGKEEDGAPRLTAQELQVERERRRVRKEARRARKITRRNRK